MKNRKSRLLTGLSVIILLTGLFLLIALTVCTGGSAWAQAIDLAKMNPYVAGSVAAAGCSASTEYVGTNRSFIGSNNYNANENYLYCARAQASCSGAPNTAYVWHYGTSADKVKVVLYASSGATPDKNDDQICVSGEISSSADQLESISVASTCTAPLTKDAWYWVCIISDSTAWTYNYRTTLGNEYYHSFAGGYASPPDPLGASYSDTVNAVPLMYFSLGD